MKGLSPDEIRDLIVSVGTHRSQRYLLPIDVANLIQKSLHAGSDLDEISGSLTLSKRVIQKFLSLQILPMEIHMVVGWGSDPTTISFTSAAEIARLNNEEEMRVLARAALENEITVPEMKQIIQIRKRSGKSINNSIEDVLKQRVEIEKRFLIIGKIVHEDLIEIIGAMSQSERIRILKEVLIFNGLGEPIFGFKLTPEYFYLVGDDEYQEKITSLPGGFEREISDYLKNKIEEQGL